MKITTLMQVVGQALSPKAEATLQPEAENDAARGEMVVLSAATPPKTVHR